MCLRMSDQFFLWSVFQVRALLWMSSELKNLTDDYTKEAVISSSATATVLDVPYQIKPETQSKSSFSVMSYFEKYRPTKVRCIK